MSKHISTVVEIPVDSVVVYLDRAEIRRSLKIKLDQGEQEVIVQGLSETLDKDSIRVEGKGSASITEVSYQEKITESPKDGLPETPRELLELQKKRKYLEAEKARVQKRKEIILGLGLQVETPNNNTRDHSTAPSSLLSTERLEGMARFLDMFKVKLSEVDSEWFDIEEKIEETEARLQVVQQKMYTDQLSSYQVTTNRQVSILLNCRESGEMLLTISYLLHGASWKPQYDIRAFSDDKMVNITYFGLIKQRTGEDWLDAKLYLSTATPSVGGTVPVLSTQTVEFCRPPRPPPPPQPVMMKRSMRSEAESVQFDSDGYAGPRMMAMSACMPMMDVAVAEVQSGSLSAMYEIARKTSIPTDNTEHKVTVALINLKPEFEHVTVPKLNTNVYLKAKLTNTSPYLILAGPTNIFIDQNFVAKAELPVVSPSEEFECSLGVDAAVKVVYKPVSKFNEQSGMISKVAKTSYKQEIEVKNAHTHDTVVQVEEQLPLSRDEKIKITVLVPTLPKDKETKEGPIILNKKNNIVWRSTIKAGQTEVFTLHYAVERPAGSAELYFADVV